MNHLEEQPFAQAVSPEFWSGKICFSCFNILRKPRKCGRCSQAWYCSDVCQMKDWSTGQHKNECRAFRVAAERSESMDAIISDRGLRGIARVISRKVTEKSSNSPKIMFKGWPENMKIRELSDLCSHLEFVMNDVEVCHDIKPAWDLFQKHYAPASKLFQSVSLGQFEHYTGLWLVNNMAVELIPHCDEFQVLGAALYLQTSRFDHTCAEPDLIRYFCGAKICLIPTSPQVHIEAINLDGLKISYLANSALTSTANRQEHLVSNYLFVCQCKECKDGVSDAVKGGALKEECSKCKTPLLLRTPDGQLLTMATLAEFGKAYDEYNSANMYCIKCQRNGAAISKPDVKELIRIFCSIDSQGPTFNGPSSSCSLLETIATASNYLHSTHNAALAYAALKVLEKWKRFTEKEEDFEQFSCIARMVISRLDTLDSWEWIRGISCCRFALFLEKAGRKLEAKAFAEKAKEAWIRLTCEDYVALNEIEELLNRL